MKKSDPSFDGSLSRVSSLPIYGSRRHLSEFELYVLRLTRLTNYSENEPISITRARKRIEVALITYDHFKEMGLPPIYDAFEYEALKERGVA